MNLNTQDKIDALRELTRGAEDVFAMHVLTKRQGEARWRPVYSKLSDASIRLHLLGHVEIGSYPLIPRDPWPMCYWICADFDGKRIMTDWKRDVQRLVPFLMDFDGCPVFVNLSRSGHGAHVRMLFREPVPAWMARRWFTSWMQEAGIVDDPEGFESEIPSSFDRLIPPQDVLKIGFNKQGNRLPGNLAGNPLHAGHARANGGTLPLDPEAVARGDFDPDGHHWDHVMAALEARTWGPNELRQALKDDGLPLDPPSYNWSGDGTPRRALPVVPGDNGQLSYMLTLCAFIEHIMVPGAQSYPLWVALASQLHRFGDEGERVFHEISSQDPRYIPNDTDLKWKQTADMHPVRCDTLVPMGFTCPHLRGPRCNGAKAPSYFADHTDAEIL